MKQEKEQKKDIFIISVEDITSKKNPKRKRYLVETNEDSYRFDEDTVIKFMLFKDHEFTKDEFKEVIYQAKVNETFNKALNYLSRVKKTTYEVKEYLRKKDDYSDDQIEKAIHRLKELQFLNDEEYAKSYLETYSLSKGPKYIINHLEQKRVHKDIIQKVMKEYNTEQEVALRIAINQKDKADLSKYPIQKQKMKIYNKLLSSGFSSEASSYALSKLEFIDESDEELKKEILKRIRKYDDSELESDLNTIKTKIIQSFIQKGYVYKKVNQYMKEILDERNN